MSEEEKIKDLKNFCAMSKKEENFTYYSEYKFYEEIAERVKGLLDLYNKEKEKNKELQNYMKQYLIPKSTIKLIYVSKEAIKEIIDKIDAEDYYCLNEAEEDLRKLVE